MDAVGEPVFGEVYGCLGDGGVTAVARHSG
ncbi:hypothetical protein JOD54_004306 [Actinokineospora baliensis]|nr:hypothetical protein [Actinokineospora baliensis]